MIFSAVFADCHSCHLCALLCHRDTTGPTLLISNDFAFDMALLRAAISARARGMLADAVIGGAFAGTQSIPHGKPQPGEYTLLAGFAVTDPPFPTRLRAWSRSGRARSACPRRRRCPRGEALSDSHAEVIARRARSCGSTYDELARGVGRRRRRDDEARPTRRVILEAALPVGAATTPTTARVDLGAATRAPPNGRRASPRGDASIDLTDARETALVAPAGRRARYRDARKLSHALFRAENVCGAPRTARRTSAGPGAGSGSGAAFVNFFGCDGRQECSNRARCPFAREREALRVDAERRRRRGIRLGACRLPGRAGDGLHELQRQDRARRVATGLVGGVAVVAHLACVRPYRIAAIISNHHKYHN